MAHLVMQLSKEKKSNNGRDISKKIQIILKGLLWPDAVELAQKSSYSNKPGLYVFTEVNK